MNRGRALVLGGLAAAAIIGGIITVAELNPATGAVTPRVMDRRCRGGCTASGEAPILFALKGGPGPSQVAAATLTDSKGNAASWSRSTPGYIETGVPLDTQMFSNALALSASPWQRYGAVSAAPTVTDGTTDVLDPDGRNHATKIVYPSTTAAGSTSVLYRNDIITSAGGFTWSVKLRTASGTATVYMGSDGATPGEVTCSVTSGWSPCLLPATWTAATHNIQIGVNQDRGDTGQPAQTIYAYGMKLESGNSATAFHLPPLMLIGADLPRVSPLGVLVERSGTNSALYSEDLTNAAWNKRGSVSIAVSPRMAPNGTGTAQRVSGVTTPVTGDYYQVITQSGNNQAPSFYINRVSTSGVITLQAPSSPDNGKWTIDMSCLPDGWYRIQHGASCVTEVTPWGASANGVYVHADTGGPVTFDSWGYDFEAGLLDSTSYTPTTSSSATRSADVGSLPLPTGVGTGAATSYCYGAKFTQEGSWLGVGGAAELLQLGGLFATNSSRIEYQSGAAQIYQWVYDSTTTLNYNFYTASFVDSSTHALKACNTAGALTTYLDGTIVTTTSGSFGGNGQWDAAPTTLYLGSDSATKQPNAYLSDICVSKTPKGCP